MTAQMKFASTELRSATAVADTAEIFSKCRELILHCSPEFKSFPLYITEPAADHVGASECHGFVQPGSYQITEHLIRQGLWVGPGHAIVLCGLSLPLPRLLAIALHEAAHLLPLKSPCLRSRIEPSRGQVESEKSRALVAIQDEVKAKSKGWASWFPHHGRSFTRRMAHLTWRAAEHGLSAGWMHGCFAGPQYAMGEPWEFSAALRNEPSRLAHCTFEEIAATPEPAAFGELFIESTRNFKGKQHADSNR